MLSPYADAASEYGRHRAWYLAPERPCSSNIRILVASLSAVTVEASLVHDSLLHSMSSSSMSIGSRRARPYYEVADLWECERESSASSEDVAILMRRDWNVGT